MSELRKHAESLIVAAAECHDKDEAMRYSQAALNVAHAIQVLADVERADTGAA